MNEAAPRSTLRRRVTKPPERERVGLPPRPFLYTLDQIATLLQVTEDYVKKQLIHYDRRSPGVAPTSKMRAVNIAPEGQDPVWRVAEGTLLAYLRGRGIKFYER